jgi:hypothetical protein
MNTLLVAISHKPHTKQYHHQHNNMQLLFWTALIWSFVPWVYAQLEFEYCDYSKGLAAEYLRSLTRTCSSDRSTCSAGDVCNNCVIGSPATTKCLDGCSYKWQDYSVQRSATGLYSISTIYGPGGIPTRQATPALQIDHVFTAGPVQGSLSYFFGAKTTSDPTRPVVPREGYDSVFEFNGQRCPSKQFYCDKSRTTYADTIDCSAYEGGAVINFCNKTQFDKESLSLVELLWIIPFRACSSDGTTGVTTKSPIRQPVKAPTKAPPVRASSKSPTMRPNVRGNATPTKAPVKAPVASDPTTKIPTKSPVTVTKAPKCGLLAWRCLLTRCGMVGRTLGWCKK